MQTAVSGPVRPGTGVPWPRTPPTSSPSRSPRRAARPSGSSRSFGKELFLGNFRLDLIHPQPRARPGRRSRRARRSSQRLRTFLDRARRPAADRARRARSPTTSSTGLKELGALGMKIPEEYGGLGPQPGLLQQGAGAGRHVALVDLDAAVAPTSRSACPSRCACSAPRSRSASGCPSVATDPHLRVPAHRARRRLRPGAHEHDRGPDRGRHGLPDQRHEAVGHQRRDRRRRRGHGRRPEVRGPPGRHHRVHLPVRRARASPSSTATSSWACAASRTRVTTLRRRLRPERERDRRRGQGPADRAVDAEHRPPVAAGDLRGDDASTR